MTSQNINEFIIKKAERQAILRHRKVELEQLDFDLIGSKFTRGLRTTYYFIKRILLLLLGIVLLVTGLTFFMAPDIIFDSPETKALIIDEVSKDEIKDFKTKVVQASLETNLTERKNLFDLTIDTFVNARKKMIEEEVTFAIQFLAVLIILLAISFFYISRLSRKLQKRNQLISKADTLTQNILRDYQLTIDEEEKELDLMKGMLTQNSPNSDPNKPI
ncbi:hypothetical protein [Nonlabens ulvanivorans]|uniref:Uncharacterized protein n=1 Tax=Nonlabens ulvanivorans TaxID=906888 RepID=A0A084JWZ4_NONUL|nr:hypothetical protein [Nonlabens ulvanivorans]KEZ93478.1 hypothetical protein IL45_04480 [Nonlabens ulvanivorans]PRX14069.1 hypothetical protein LY02_01098 [Nonlabens ulvanivorans]